MHEFWHESLNKFTMSDKGITMGYVLRVVIQ